MGITLEMLDLLPDEIKRAQARVKRMAYEKWQEAGCPAGQSLKFWREAECEWIEYEYVPHRLDRCLEMA